MKKFCLIIIIPFILFSFINISIAEINKEYDTAVQYYNTGKYREAINLLKIYVAKRPEPSAYYRIGYALYKLKQFDEANKYFEMTYLIDPEFSPQRTGLTELPEKMKMSMKSRKKTILKEEVPYTENIPGQIIENQEPASEQDFLKEVKPAETQKPILTPETKSPLPETQKAEPPSPSIMFPKHPVGKKPYTSMETRRLFAKGVATIILLVDIAIYIFFSLCLFIIAKKLHVPAPWTAWIPIVQIWTIVASAGRPWWWILLFLVPIVNIVIGIYLWVLITENLGRNKWLGLLMLLPIVNFVFLGILAFSKSGGGYIAEAEV